MRTLLLVLGFEIFHQRDQSIDPFDREGVLDADSHAADVTVAPEAVESGGGFGVILNDLPL